MTEAASPAKTKLTISASTFEGVNTFSGFVISKKDGCHNGRTVRVYERAGATRNLKRDPRATLSIVATVATSGLASGR